MENKTEKIKVGDLVCMPRRRIPGMGIVVRYSDNLAKEGGINVMKILEETRDFISYTDRSQIFKNAYHRCGDAEFLDQAFYYNAGWVRKPKLKFAYIKWMRKPSDYAMKAVFAPEAWYPVEWLKSY